VAIEFVGSAEGSAVNGANVTLTLPTAQQNDLVIVAYAIGDNDSVDQNMAMVTADYNEVADLFSDETALDLNLGVFWKVMGATPDTTAVVDGALSGLSGADAAVAAVAMVFRGVDTTTPMDVAATTDTGIDTMHPNPPSINHNNPSGVWTVIVGASAHTLGAAGTYTFPTGYTTNKLEDGENDTSDVTVGMGYNTGPSDPEDPGVMTHSGTDNVAYCWAAVTMALRPAAANVTATPTTATLTTATFAPTVTASDHKIVTPTTKALTTSTFAPSVTVGVSVTPTTAALSTTGFAPTVTATQHQTVTPTTKALSLSTFAPTVTASSGQTVTPSAASLTLSSFAPTVTATGAQPAPAVESRGRSGRRRYRIIEDPDRLEEELRVEEKKVEKEKKKLKILIKRVESPNVEGVLYQQIQAKVEKLEAKIDDRMERISGLMLAIQVGLDEQDDDEEEVLLMS
jgi:hypothetical protein